MDGLSIAASLTEISPRLADSTIRTIYQPDKMRLVLRVFAGEDIRLVLDLGESGIRITTRDIENPAKPSAFVMLLRKHLRGGRVEALSQSGWDRVVSMRIVRNEGAQRLSYQLIAELIGTRGNLHLLKDDILVQSLRSDRRNSMGHPYVGLPPQDKFDPGSITPAKVETWLSDGSLAEILARRIEGIGRQTAADVAAQATGDDSALELNMRLKVLLTYVRNPEAHVTEDETRATFYPLPSPAVPAESFQGALDRLATTSRQESQPPQDPLLQELKRAVRKKERTIVKLLDWLDDSSQEDVWQSHADLLMTFKADIQRGQTTATLVDPEDEREVTIVLDPSLSALENAQSLYKRAKRIRRGHPHVHSRLARSKRELSQLQAALEQQQRGEAIDSNILKLLSRRDSKKSPPKKAVPFRQFEADGFQIWVGKSARQNDALLRAASPNDVWMHAKNYAGSHVVVRARGQSKIPDAVVQAAARLAALHSKAKSERRVEVTMTQVKKVRKPKGAPAGLVNVRDTDTLTVELTEGEA